MSRDKTYKTARILASVIKRDLNVTLTRPQQLDFFKFMSMYWLSVNSLGMYLTDVDFQEIIEPERKQITHSAFSMWISLKSD